MEIARGIVCQTALDDQDLNYFLPKSGTMSQWTVLKVANLKSNGHCCDNCFDVFHKADI